MDKIKFILKFINDNEVIFSGFSLVIASGIIALFKKYIIRMFREKLKKKKINEKLDKASNILFVNKNENEAIILYNEILSLDSNNMKAKEMLNTIDEQNINMKVNKLLDEAWVLFVKENNFFKARLMCKEVLLLEPNNRRAALMLASIKESELKSDPNVIKTIYFKKYRLEDYIEGYHLKLAIGIIILFFILLLMILGA